MFGRPLGVMDATCCTLGNTTLTCKPGNNTKACHLCVGPQAGKDSATFSSCNTGNPAIWTLRIFGSCGF